MFNILTKHPHKINVTAPLGAPFELIRALAVREAQKAGIEVKEWGKFELNGHSITNPDMFDTRYGVYEFYYA